MINRESMQEPPVKALKRCMAQNCRPQAYLLQRFVAHYRMPVFSKLAETSHYSWKFCSDLPEQLGSGLPATDLVRLDHCRVRNRHIAGPFLYQSGLRFGRDCRAIVMDIGLPLLSAPRYLVEARLRGIGCVGWTKGIPQNPNSDANVVRRLYQRWLLGLAHTLVVYSKLSRDYVVARGYPRDRVHVAQNTVDTRAIATDTERYAREGRDLRARLGIPGERVVCGFLGKMAPFKRVDAIVEAFTAAAARGMEADLVLAGRGPSLDHLRAVAAASAVADRIRFLPDVPAGAEGAVFQLFDLYLSFSQGGLGILESMAHGTPVLSSPERYPETELLEDGETAFLAANTSPEAFARRMAEAVADAPRRRRVAEHARARVLAEATVEGMVAAIDRAVDAAIAKAERGNGKAKS